MSRFQRAYINHEKNALKKEKQLSNFVLLVKTITVETINGYQ
jgi:hypothetical protein